MKRSLYQCYNSRVKEDRIYCAKGHRLFQLTKEGSLNIERLARGEPLELKVCQDCPDYDEMGEPIPPEERGWVTSEVHRGRPKKLN